MLAALAGVTAATTPTRAPAAVAAADPAALFGTQESVLAPALSPDGKRIVYIAPGQGRSNVVVVYDLGTRKYSAVTRADGNPMRMSRCGWAAPERLVCEGTGLLKNAGAGQAEVRFNSMNGTQGATSRGASDAQNSEAQGALLTPFVRLMALDTDGKNTMQLGRPDTPTQLYVRQYDGQVLDWLDGDGTVLMSRFYVPEMNTGRLTAQVDEGFSVEKMDTRTLKSTVIERPKPDVLYMADGHGAIRLSTRLGVAPDGQLSGDDTHFYRRPNDRDWRELGGREIQPLAVDSSINAAYVLKTLNNHKALYRITLDEALRQELVFENATADLDEVVSIGRGHVIGARYFTDRAHVEYFGAYRQLASDLARALPNAPVVDFVSSSADEKVLLIHAGNGEDPGRYLVFDRSDNRLTGLFTSRADFDNVALGSTTPVKYDATDGTALSGYLTLPPGVDKANGLPAVVLPHGGAGALDTWGFNWLAQFYATRGFAVLQPNYRGGAGSGDAWFIANGFRSWPDAVADVVTGARWLLGQGVDASRLAIAGWSFGGYTALQASVVEPDLFKAVVAIAPVTDLEQLAYQRRSVNTERLRRAYIGNGAHIDAGSPQRHADRIKAPVMLFGGDLDLEVDVAEFSDMDKALKKAGRQSEVVVYPNLDHTLPDSAARADMLRRSYQFLQTTLKLE